MSKRLIYSAVLITGLGLLVLLLYPRLSGNSGEAQITAQNSPSSATDNRFAVRGSVVEAADFTNRVVATGSVRADEQVLLSAEVSGRITGIYFEEGGLVRKGDLLVKLNDSQLQAELRRAEYRRNLARIREQRIASLIERNASAQEEYDVALNELNVANAEAELIEARIALTEIRAPFDGVIGLRNVSEGRYVTPQDYIAELQKVDRVKVDFSIPERYSQFISRGQPFMFMRQGTRNEYSGEVFAIQPRINADTRTLSIRGLASNPDRQILPGAFVEVQVPLRTIDDALMVPSEAIIPEMGGQSLFLYKGGKAERRQVQIGVRTDRSVQITEGVAAGDTVLTTGMLQLRSGMDVRLVNIN
ncbi:MAG: efflux RND transporter periplasmic adaptor subunit [Balneolales bacterium]|nr:efflux RND transporter periplasmic adaptor subunit [Balneolales bacterium]